MKVKTSITLSPETLRIVDRLAGRRSNRSRVIEAAVLQLARQQKAAERDARELALLNRRAEALNAEMEDVLRDQADL